MEDQHIIITDKYYPTYNKVAIDRRPERYQTINIQEGNYDLVQLVVDQTDCVPAIAQDALRYCNNDVVSAIMRIQNQRQ